MSDRLQEIHARLSDAMGDGSAMPWQHDDPGECVRSVNGREIASVPFYDERDFIAHAPADIAWLLEEVIRLREIEQHDDHWRRQFYALRNRVRKAGISI